MEREEGFFETGLFGGRLGKAVERELGAARDKEVHNASAPR